MKSNSISSLIVLLLITAFLNRLVFTIIVPIWHTPDEQAHFAQVAYFAEFNSMPLTGYDLNKEINSSEILLGTDRDISGNNKFTFHPEYRIEYTESLVGKYENQINSLPIETRFALVKQEAANYPPLYYWAGSAFYKVFYYSGLIDRVYAVRILSIILSTLTVWAVYLISKQLFPKDKLLQISLPVLVSFQPMFSFVSAGVNSDNLMNLLFTCVIYTAILLIVYGPTRKIILLNLVIVFLLFLTKPQFLFSIPIIVVAGLMYFLINKKVRSSLKILMVLIPTLGFLLLIYALENSLLNKLIMQIPFLYSYYPHHEVGNDLSFMTFFKQSLIHTFREVIPWYWGVFDWLGVVLPRDINRIINRLMVLVGIGLIIKLYQIYKKRTKEDFVFIFLIFCAAIYYMGIIYYNYLFTLGHGFPFGIQGRYFFPTIVSHMAIMLVGIRALIPDKFKRLQQLVVKAFVLGMIVLNFSALFLISAIYYDMSQFNTFINQVSQYKPIIFKGSWLIGWGLLYVSVLFIFIIRFIRIFYRN